jgi:cold shock CspA family protein
MPMGGFMRGHLKWYDASRGFGFITPEGGGPDAFLQKTELLDGDAPPLQRGDPVEFELAPGGIAPAAVRVRRVTLQPEFDWSEVQGQADNVSDATASLLVMMQPEERARLCFDALSLAQREALIDWGMRMFQLGRHRVAEIDQIKYEGRLIVLDDGSRWEVDTADAVTAETWSAFERVVVVDNAMYRLDELEKVQVEEELGR